MTESEISSAIMDILQGISPDEEIGDLKEDVPFRDQLEMDSMDFLDIVMELRKRYRIQVPEEDYETPLGVAAVPREGSDVTLVGIGATVPVALEAADHLAQEGTSAEVLDLRTLAPLDEEAVLSSLAKTGRLVVVDEATPHFSMASEIAALCVDRGFDLLNAPVKKVTAPHTPVPFSPVLEDAYRPSAQNVVAAVHELG